MDKKLSSLFENLTKEETALLAKRNDDLSTDISSETKKKIAKTINLKTGLNLQTAEKGVVRKFKSKPLKVALIAAVVAALLAVSAGAAYNFIMPEGFFNDQEGIVFDSIYTVVDTDKAGKDEFKTVHKTVKSNEYTITFEAIAKGKIIKTVYEDPFSLIGKSPEEIAQAKKWQEIEADKLYAIFTIKADDGQQIIGNKIDMGEIGYNIAIKGYDPSSCFFGIHDQYVYEENGVLYYVCNVTDAGIFADNEIRISIFENWHSDATVLRMDENGDPYFVESFDGFKAMFDLNLDKSLADSEKAKAFAKENYFNTNPDYSWSDRVIAKDEAFKESGTDLSEFIGDNEWKGSYELQFGEVKMADEYLELQKNRTEEMNVYTCRELCETINENATDEFFANLKKFDPEKEEAMIPAEWLSANAYTAKLSDGSEVKYLGDQLYIHFETGGDMKLIVVPCHNMVFEFDMTIDNVNNICIRCLEDSKFFWYPEDSEAIGIADIYRIGLYIDKELTRPNLKKYLAASDETQEDIFSHFSDFESEEDAIFAMASNFSAYSGIVQVVK